MKRRNKKVTDNQPYKQGVVTKKEGVAPDSIVVNEMNVMSIDRSKKDIGDAVSAIQSAESIHNPSRVQIYNLYERAYLDPFLRGLIRKRLDNVLNKELLFSKDGKEEEAFEKLFENLAFREACAVFLESERWGASGIESIKGEDFDFIEIPRKHIKPDQRIISIDQYGYEGYEYDALENVYVIGKPNELGSLLQCIMHIIYKQANWADWAQYIEIFGQPVRIIYYDAYDTTTKNELKAVLDESGSSLALMIPKQATFEMKDGKQSNGDGKLQDTFRNAINEELSILILGNTETSGNANGGSNAKAQVQAKQQEQITKSDMKFLLAHLNSKKFLNILKSYGYPVEGGKFQFKKELDLEALKNRYEIDKDLGNKIPIADDYYYDTYGIPKPDNYDELKAKQEADKQAALKPMLPAAEEDEEDPAEEGKKPNAQKPPKAAKKNVKDLSAEDIITKEQKKTILYKALSRLADFFDPAP